MQEHFFNLRSLKKKKFCHSQPEWMKTKEYWDKTFETRYELLKKDTTRPPLKVKGCSQRVICGILCKLNVFIGHHCATFA